jgi:ABC-2 type transport system ATP-binding protein
VTHAPSIEFQNVSRRFEDIGVLNSFDLVIPGGAVCGVTGPNGAGKSTMLALAAGVLAPTEGKILYDGVEVDRALRQELRIGFFSSQSMLPPMLTVGECLRLHCASHCVRVTDREVQNVLEQLNIDNLIGHKFADISAGQKVLVKICCSLVTRPNVLLMDEPTVFLDEKYSHTVRTTLQQALREGVSTAVIASHNRQDISELCQYSIRISSNSVSPLEVIHDEA